MEPKRMTFTDGNQLQPAEAPRAKFNEQRAPRAWTKEMRAAVFKQAVESGFSSIARGPSR